jgi:hypothetical protein
VNQPVPTTVRAAGWIVAAQGAAALVMAATLVVRGLTGADQHIVNGLGTAVWFVLVGAAVLAAGRALMIGRRWGRGLAVAWYLGVGSHRPEFGIPVAIVALGALLLLFSPGAVRWAAGGDQRGPASSANRGPDSR